MLRKYYIGGNSTCRKCSSFDHADGCSTTTSSSSSTRDAPTLNSMHDSFRGVDSYSVIMILIMIQAFSYSEIRSQHPLARHSQESSLLAFCLGGGTGFNSSSRCRCCCRCGMESMKLTNGMQQESMKTTGRTRCIKIKTCHGVTGGCSPCYNWRSQQCVGEKRWRGRIEYCCSCFRVLFLHMETIPETCLKGMHDICGRFGTGTCADKNMSQTIVNAFEAHGRILAGQEERCRRVMVRTTVMMTCKSDSFSIDKLMPERFQGIVLQ